VGAQLVFTIGVSLILFHGGTGISLRVISRTAVGLGLLVLSGYIAVSMVALAVCVTLLLQATTAGPLARKLGLSEK
jgi:NhaP-type Na+/H+ or K+/H+ antiporter